jgi:hypothetical protein
MNFIIAFFATIRSWILYIADALYLTQTLDLIGDALARVSNSLEYAWTNYPYIILLYILLLVGIIVFHGRIRDSHRKVSQWFEYEIDRLFYQIDKELYTQKNEIQKYSETCEVVNAHKKQLFDPQKWTKKYSDITQGLMNDIKYLEQLLNITMISPDQENKLTSLGVYLQRSETMYYALGNTLGVLTLWLYALFQSRL